MMKLIRGSVTAEFFGRTVTMEVRPGDVLVPFDDTQLANEGKTQHLVQQLADQVREVNDLPAVVQATDAQPVVADNAGSDSQWTDAPGDVAVVKPPVAGIPRHKDSATGGNVKKPKEEQGPTKTERILEALQVGPLSTAEIADAIGDEDLAKTTAMVQWLVKTGRVQRMGQGKYARVAV